MSLQAAYFIRENTTADGKEVKILLTRGLFFEISPVVVNRMVKTALQKLVGKVSWVVFSPEAKKCYLDDEGRTCIFPMSWMIKNYNKKVYAILDDYGSVEALQESAGDRNITTQFVLTLLFASEY